MFPYNPILQEQALYMKLNLSKADKVLESIIKKNFPDLPFEMKVPVDDYIVDFLFEEKKVAIEIDAGQQENTDAYVYHAERKERLEAVGLKLLRIDEKELILDNEKTIVNILSNILK